MISKIWSERMRNKGKKATRKLTYPAVEIKIRDKERFHEEKISDKLEKRSRSKADHIES